MNYIRISELNFSENIGNRVFVKFLVRDTDVRKQKDGKDYVVFNMADKDVIVEARLFAATQSQIDIIRNGTVCIAAVDIKEYSKASTGYSCIIYNIDATQDDPSGYVAWTPGVGVACQYIASTLKEIIDTDLGTIANRIYCPVWERFMRWTAAKGMHHNLMGGLCVHTYEVLKISIMLADFYSKLYPNINIDMTLVKCAALLHDIGKLDELDVDELSGTTKNSAEAALVSHIVIGISEVNVAARELGIGYQTYLKGTEGDKQLDMIMKEKERVNLLVHCIASHHGRMEWGSPVTPAIPEAYIVNSADGISASMYSINKGLAEINPGGSLSVWSSEGYRNIFKPSL